MSNGAIRKAVPKPDIFRNSRMIYITWSAVARACVGLIKTTDLYNWQPEWQTKHGGSPPLGVLALNDLGPLPKSDPKEVLVRIHAFALNYRDKVVVDHNPSYPLKVKANLIPGSDAAGVVEDAGPKSRWKKGDRVNIHPNTWMYGTDDRDFKFDATLGGGDVDETFRRWMIVDDEMLFKASGGLSMTEACTLFTAGVRA